MKVARKALGMWQQLDDEEYDSSIPPYEDSKSYYDISKIFKEQDVPPEDEEAVDPNGQAPTEDPNDMADPSMQDPNAAEGPTTPLEVGRLYELKKIHARLVSLQSFLSDSTDPQLVELKKYINNAIELFRTLISNIKLFTTQLDEIIIMFYKFLDEVFSMLSNYYKTNVNGMSKFVRTWGK